MAENENEQITEIESIALNDYANQGVLIANMLKNGFSLSIDSYNTDLDSKKNFIRQVNSTISALPPLERKSKKYLDPLVVKLKKIEAQLDAKEPVNVSLLKGEVKLLKSFIHAQKLLASQGRRS